MTSRVGTFLAMGGYAAFVWPAYAIAFAVLAGVAVFSWRRYRDSIETLERLQAEFGRRR